MAARILIVKLGAIGDVLRTTSLLPGLKEKFEPSEIDWVTYENSEELLYKNPHLRKIFVWGEPVGEYDLAIGLEDDKEACEFVSSVKAGKMIGAYSEKGKITYTPSAWFDMSMISKYGIEKANELKKLNRKTYQQHMADLLGIKVSPYVFSLTPEEIEYGEKIVRGLGIEAKDKVIGVNTGAGRRWPQKSWGVEQTIELIKRLGAVCLILGGEEERERNRKIASETGMPEAGVHSLRYFASIINQCKVVLSSDSLAMHFAIALRKRTVAFFGPTSAAEIELYGLGEKLTSSIECLTCYKKGCQIVPNCMDRLSVEDVFQSVKRQL